MANKSGLSVLVRVKVCCSSHLNLQAHDRDTARVQHTSEPQAAPGHTAWYAFCASRIIPRRPLDKHLTVWYNIGVD